MEEECKKKRKEKVSGRRQEREGVSTQKNLWWCRIARECQKMKKTGCQMRREGRGQKRQQGSVLAFIVSMLDIPSVE